MYLWNGVPASSSKKKTSATYLRSCLSLTSCYSPQILKRNIVCLLLTISISARIRPKVTEKTNPFSQSFGRGQFVGWRELERAMTFTSHKNFKRILFQLLEWFVAFSLVQFLKIIKTVRGWMTQKCDLPVELDIYLS